MKSSLVIAVLISCTLLIYGCCKCILREDVVSLNVISAQTGQDLIFGPASQYQSSQIKMYAMRGSDTVWLGVYLQPRDTLQKDSSLLLAFHALDLDLAYLVLSPSDQDTIQLKRHEVKKGCCKGNFYIDEVYYNQSKLIPENGFYIAKK